MGTSQDIPDKIAQRMEELHAADLIEQIFSAFPEASLNKIRMWELGFTSALVAGVMADPILQPNWARLEALQHIVVAFARGDTRPSTQDLAAVINAGFSSSLLRNLEDPIDDVCIANVITNRGNRRVFCGNWEGADFWLQEALDATRDLGDHSLQEQVAALLLLSDEIATRTGLARFVSSEGAPTRAVSIVGDPEALALRVSFSTADLDKLGIRPEHLQPFEFDFARYSQLREQRLQSSSLERHPLLKIDGKWIVAIPAAIGASIRRHILLAFGRVPQRWPNFIKGLKSQQERRVFSNATRPLRGNKLADWTPEGVTPPGFVCAEAYSFDENKGLHLLLLHDDLNAAVQDGLLVQHLPSHADQLRLTAHVALASQVFGSRGLSSGLTVAVIGGVGRGIGLQYSPAMQRGWGFQFWSLSDFVRFTEWHGQDWPLQLWKFAEHLKVAESRGIPIVASGGFVELYSYWEANGYRLLPRHCPVALESLNVSVEPGYSFSFRSKARKALDWHGARRAGESDWLPFRRLNYKSLFKQEENRPIYVSPDDIAHGRLRGMAETSARRYWIECVPVGQDEGQFDMQAHLLETALKWAMRLSRTLEVHLNALEGDVAVQIDFSDESLWECRTAETSAASVEAEITSANEVRLRLRPEMWSLLRRPQNLFERELVEAFANGCLALAGAGDANIARELANGAVPSDQARFMHTFVLQNVRDEIAQFKRTSARIVAEPDQSLTMLGLAWEVETPREDSFTIEGTDGCGKFLNSTVDALWRKIKGELVKLDRRSALVACLGNLDALEIDRALWRRTSQAIIALTEDEREALDVSQKHENDISRATIATRVLAEMALCTCPSEGGDEIGSAEYDALLARVSHLVAIAHASDGIRANFAKPEVRIFPNGEFINSQEYVEEVLRPYQDGYFVDLLEKSAETYSELYRERASRRIEDVVEAEFVDAFRTEHGFSLPQLLSVADAMEQYAVDRKSFVAEISRDELVRLLALASLNHEESEAFLRRFCLTSRPRWDSAPAGFENKDWYPWRFGRRLSLLARPILDLGDLMIFSPGLNRDAFAQAVGGAHDGSLGPEFLSDLMKAWVGRANNRRGHEFNDRVAREFGALGLHARASVRMTELLVPRDLGDLGDIDVLAWEGGRVYVVECKSLWFARTVGEIAEQLRRFKGEANDEMAKHLRRSEWLNNNRQEVARVLNLGTISGIKALMVTNTVVPMQYTRGLPMPPEDVIPISKLRERFDVISRETPTSGGGASVNQSGKP